MFEFQEDGIAWLRSKTHALLGDEPGLGKTRQLLLAAEGRTLVVAPAMLLGVWEEELARWRPDLELDLVSYSALCETEPGPRGGRVSKPVPLASYRHPWDTLIFDEAHYLKSRTAAWSLAAEKLAKQADRVWLATGTPIPNWAEEIWHLLKVLRPGDLRFSSYWRWVEHWFDIWKPSFGGTKIGKLRKNRTWGQWYDENLGELYLARTWDQLEDQLPPLRRQFVHVDMTPEQGRFYRKLKKEYVASLPNGDEVVAWNSGSLESKLAMASTGLELLGSRGSGKLRMVGEYLDDWAGLPVVVVTQLRATARIVAEMVEKRNGEAIVCTGGVPPTARFALAQRFQAGEGDVLVATIESIAEGLTLTRASRILFVERSYRPSKNKQVERRIWRISQVNPCLSVQLVTRGTLDERVIKLLTSKTDQQMKALRRKDFARLL